MEAGFEGIFQKETIYIPIFVFIAIIVVSTIFRLYRAEIEAWLKLGLYGQRWLKFVTIEVLATAGIFALGGLPIGLLAAWVTILSLVPLIVTLWFHRRKSRK